MTDNTVSPDTKIDLTNCDREPIHLLGHVQQFGCLIAVNADWIVCYVSRNVTDFLGLDAEEMIGNPIRDYFSEAALHELRGRVQQLDSEDAVERLFGLQLREADEQAFNAGVHISGRNIVIELEPHEASHRTDYTSLVRPMIDRLRKARSIDQLCQLAARQLKALTGFDRVMVYRFAEDQSGEVIAESVSPNIDSFKGLRYPATDIPQQARELYRRNLLRIISDVNGEVSPIIPARGPEGDLLDLSMSGLRAVSPIHIEYLQNMGVEASMSVSILRRGKLWGLFACHHYSPRVLSYDVRSAADLFAQMFSFVLDQLSNDVVHEQQERTQRLHDQLMSQLAGGQSIKDHFPAITDALSSVIPNDGVAAWVDGEFLSSGTTPDAAAFMEIVRFLNTTAGSRVYATEKLGEVHPPAKAYVDRAAGLLALPVSRVPRDYIVLFRQEITKKVNWAGNPEKPATLGPNGARLTPRKSFEAWQETVHGQSAPWTDTEVSAAEQLRVTLLEVVLRMSETVSQERIRANERQELLIAELNHRVRNILNLISGVVAQSTQDARSVSDYAKVVSGRIQALARAHDQITEKNWAPSSLRALIFTELDAYFGPKSNRAIIQGGDALLEPAAFSTLALVMHELATNSAKYGALSDSSGKIEVTIDQTPNGGVSLTWRERGGPPVQAPARQGFGSTIIEKSIPYELGGSADVRFQLTGLEADFTVPNAFVQSFIEVEEDSPEAARHPKASRTDGLLSGPVLVLEDNMIIAMNAEGLVMEAGASSVSICASVEQALEAIREQDFTIALLDVNLGKETSEPVADALVERGVPFVFATGYGDGSALAARFPNVPILSKPYRGETLTDKLEAALQLARA
ncbi:HWE histidine kinase domain-containing protein [Henriciella aquimarina]|uniref:HWE histidine kinase domain-containing protein n=1 Tax=Henriciella aquimarina TaxID=545261 RepID=UPI000A02B035|nr:HWE histidine kinase domain-containing protein [Henriciella aquimarina]